jgi:nucleotide-binding universal stress UspA family protein
MSEPKKTMRILVPIDFSQTSLNGLEQAVCLAQKLGARLDLIHVVEYDPTRHAMQVGVDWSRPETREALSRKLEDLIATKVGAGVPASAEVLVEHEVGSSIVAAAERIHSIGECCSK